MVGFKSIWLLLSLLIFAACVPQTKQTECASNEAFNATLRTCVPVMNGPSSFINIDSFLPTFSLTKYKNDTTPITLSVVISNPYAQTYTVEWERVYNGSPVAISPSTQTSYTFAPSLLASEVGTHIISVKIKDTTNNIVDSHSFELKINDNPKPVIQSATVTPPIYASAFTPLSSTQAFAFTVYNNGATMAGAGYRTDWKLYRSGLLINSETDSFPTSSPLGSLSTGGYNYPVYSFNPSVLGLGSYVLIARVTNTAAEVVAEQQWSATVAHPALSKVTNRDIYTSSPGTSWATSTIAYNGVAYTGSPTYNFIPSTITTPVAGAQGNYCVSVAAGTGTYSTDAYSVRVSYYLDGSALVYSGLTTAVDNQVCLTDATAASLSAVVFSNTTSTTAQTHYLVARVVDEATGQEYTSTDLNSALLGTYPLTWNFDVRPQNKAPTAGFGTMTGITCSSTSSTTQSGCTVTSDTNFTVKVNLTDDDFYYPITVSNEAHFDYSIRLYENSVNIQTCTKASVGADTNGADGYDCVFNIKSYNGSGPIDLSTKAYTIQAEIIDNGSPISGTGATSNSLTWDIAMGAVTEFNSAPTIGATWSVLTPVAEGSAITFSVDITDAERDNHTYEIFYCPTALVLGACSSPTSLIPETTVTRTTNAATVSVSTNYTFSEGFLLGLTGIGCDTVKRGISCAVNFLVKVKDVPNTATPSAVLISNSAASNITNTNPAPTLNTAYSVPAPSAITALTAFAFVGHPMSITNNPTSILTDTSTEPLEKDYRYQWFIKNNTSVTAWTEISGATGPNLAWTPSIIRDTNATTDNPLSIILCVEDQPASAVSSVNIIDSTCSTASPSPWVVTVKDNFKKAFDLSTITAPWASTELATSAAVGQYGTETAIWYDTPLPPFNGVTSSAVYVAMIGNDQKIHVKKSLLRALGGIDNIDDTHIVTFNAFATATVAEIKDLSITGTSTELYVAYLASQTGSPGSFYPQVRRIDLTATAGKGVPNNHPGKMGFDYNGLGFTNGCSTGCQATATSGVSTIQFSGGGFGITGSFILNTPNGDFTVSFGTYDGVSTVCGTCTDQLIATNLATIINNSTDPLLAGYSATTSGGDTVTIYGARSGDYFDGTGWRIADRMGKIYVTGGSWYLPFINTSLGSSYNDKLSVYYSPTPATGAVMNTSTVSILEPSGAAGLASMDAAIKFDNYFDGTNLRIAMVSKSGSAGKLYKVNPTTYALSDMDNIFSGQALLDVKIAASSTNVFIGATTAVGSLTKLGVYDSNGLMLDEFQIDNPTNVDASTNTDDYFNTLSISQYKIVPYGTEARLFAVSQGTPLSGSYKLYMARLRKVSSTWTLSCGDCQTASELGQNISPFVGLGVAPIRDNPSSAYRLSTDGAIPNQGLKDVAFVSMGRLETTVALPTPSSCDPAIGVYNVEAESIGSSLIFTGGVDPNEDAGLYHSPFVKN